ncbi:S41 family peptidase [Holdemania massiliensis]|uniref:S41 family peptidase n=1 Tax=Holdemania massiliensis TaxID=1468449 RepID=UPI001F05CA87|nr:S41 family peptidase [Holdemania massiliensis]MCH1942618.1 S41 family peptidase [Holdemania massiliensis]
MKSILRKITLLLPLFFLASCAVTPLSTNEAPVAEYLSAQQRIKPLIDAYTEISAHSTFWHQQPDFPYSEMLAEIIMQAAESIDVYDYCTLLERLTAVTGDAHNHFGYNTAMLNSFGYLSYELQYLDGRYIVTGVSETSQIPLGSELIQIQDQTPQTYLEENMAPLVAAESYRLKQNRMLERFTYNRKGEKILLTWKTPDNQERTTEEVYVSGGRRIIETYDQPELGNYVTEVIRQASDYDVLILENQIVYMRIRQMSDISGSYFTEVLPKIGSARKFILDIRGNRGGNDIGAFQLLSAFYDEIENFATFELAESPESFGNHSATFPQRSFDYSKPEILDLKTLFRSAEIPTIPSDQLVLLTDYNTMSAAESLALLASSLNKFTLIGTPTAGSCGLRYDVILEDLGFSFAFTTRNSLDYDGQSLYGKGIEPDKLVEQNVDDLKQGIDTVLEAALAFLHDSQPVQKE